MSDETLIWGWVIPRGGKKKPVILDRANYDEISAICEEEIHGLGYFPLYTSAPPCDLTAERDRLREALSECQTQAVKDGNEISSLKAWQAGSINCRKAEQDRIDEYKAEADRLREALEFYADELTWADTNPKNDGRLTVLVPSPSFAEIDRGERARAALSPEGIKP